MAELKDKTLNELIQLFNERMDHNYLMVDPYFHYEYPNSFEGDCLKIAHEITKKIIDSEETMNELTRNDLFSQWREFKMMSNKSKVCVFEDIKFTITDLIDRSVIRFDTLDEAVLHMMK